EEEWDGLCVMVAELFCGLVCDCTDPAGVACSTDADCGFCTESPCDATYACVAGTCQEASPGVTCDTSGDTECSKSVCMPETGACEVVSYEQCMVAHPCQPAEGP